jgi:SAM-dependent methyltransferase
MRRKLNRLADVAVVRKSQLAELRKQLDEVYAMRAMSAPPPPLPPGAEEALRSDHPLLVEYARRYRGHSAAGASQWSGDYVSNTIDIRHFRANNSYVWQQWDSADPFRYGLTTYYLRLHDRFGLFERLDEDGLFGAETYDIDGVTVSRDLLDSICELTFLEEEVGLSRGATVLDIGAGYGRLAHRATTAFENVTYICTDAVPLSTFLSGYYLQFRGVADRATVVPLDRIEEAITGTDIDLAINIHSFAEAPVNAIEWWLQLLARSAVRHLLIVPNTGPRLLSKERNAPRVDFGPLVRQAGFELVRTRPKYGTSEFMQRHGLHGTFPMHYFLFERRR